MNLHRLILFTDSSVERWATEARVLRWLTLLWLCLGLAMLFSASYPVAYATEGDGLYYLKRQLLWAVLGLAGFNLIVHLPLRYVLRASGFCVVICLGLLVATNIPGLGQSINGASRWLSLGPVPIQPSELIKPFLVLQSALVFGRWERLSWLRRLLWIGTFAAVLLGILLQPNLSTTALCGILLWLVALAADLPATYLGGTAALGVLVACISIGAREYQRRRVLSFMNPWADPQGDGYQLIQSLLAVGSGGLWGTGFGLSQQKHFYLPIQYTDFIFAVYAEEFGLIGGLVLLLLLATYATLALRVALKCKDPVHRLVAIGIGVLLVGQSLLNIGVATGALPTTGLPLPMFSYGGNSLLSSLFSAGLLVRVARESSGAQVINLGQQPENLVGLPQRADRPSPSVQPLRPRSRRGPTRPQRRVLR
ncbi:cell division protein FtsW [Leptolyngbya sp. FACHB-261]|nr:cell division protein FtsW [Leptolyngbya sp. FACHB-261]